VSDCNRRQNKLERKGGRENSKRKGRRGGKRKRKGCSASVLYLHVDWKKQKKEREKGGKNRERFVVLLFSVPAGKSFSGHLDGVHKKRRGGRQGRGKKGRKGKVTMGKANTVATGDTV